MAKDFIIIDTDDNSAARRGVLSTRHGNIETPIFMPVGTQGTVKGMTPKQLEEIGSQIILGNTYHLNLRPGAELIRDFGGLHDFMGWNGPILTDSGGFQAFSLAKLSKISDDGVSFRSHLDGSKVFLGPLEVMSIQANLGSDIAMVIDECPPWPCEKNECAKAVERTSRWAGSCLEIAGELGVLESGGLVFAIAQGSSFEDLRRQSAEELSCIEFSGYAIGGVSVGEPEEEMLHQVGSTAPYLPQDKPRYTMGLGTPPQMLKMIALGVDMFDCVLPSRVARNGAFFTRRGMKNIRNARFADDPNPLETELENYACQRFSRAYLRHLIVAKEILGCTLLTIHNLHFYLDLMSQARSHIAQGDFLQWSQAWIREYEAEES
ncbi:MAG TPA: tRNA guanosine(34) transglycosylase Tgt [Opitutae bacterium]|nr:tRNA guanosine(34) transglycosylase Tgt [Opitutaceae bacterium]HCR30445.1 tRNA guanosine(34) transglycosylase Tgt [Opitutae bacterium]